MFEHVEMFREHCYGPLDDDSGAWGLRTGDGDEPLIVVDAGMNLGLFCIYLQRHLCNSAQSRPVICLAFEPAPESYEIAVRNLRDAGVRTVDHGARMPETGQAIGNLAPGSLEVHVFQMALSADAGAAESFLFFPESSANSALARHRPDVKWPAGAVPRSVEVQVPCCSLSDALASILGGGEDVTSVAGCSWPLFLKVDVEGAEVEVLRGLTSEDWRRVEGLAVEIQGEEHLDAVRGLCASAGFGTEGGGSGGLRVVLQPHAFAGPEAPELWMLYGRR